MNKTIYLACHFTITPLSPTDEMLIALLSDAGFDSFQQTDTGVVAYIEESLWSVLLIRETLATLQSDEV